MAEIIDGKKISQQIKDELKERAAVLRAQGKTGALAVIQVGADPASCVYVRNKKILALNHLPMNCLKIPRKRNCLS